MRIDVVTLFPEMFEAIRQSGITRIALEKGLVDLGCYNPRDQTRDNYRRIDDRPYGGGPGMVMMPEPMALCIDDVRRSNGGQVIYLSPQGERLNQSVAQELAECEEMVLVCGRYEGLDQRVIDSRVDREISIGDYVLSGGELPAMVLIDAVARLLPGVLGNDSSAVEDSFQNGLLDYPHYTRPEVFERAAVPKVLLSGDHKAIAAWRKEQAEKVTRQKRSDLLDSEN